MKFLRPAFLKHLFVPCPGVVCARVHMRARRKLSSSMLPHSAANRRRGWVGREREEIGTATKVNLQF